MEIAILFALIILNGLFAMSEIALVTARKARLQKLIDEGDKAAAAAVKLGEKTMEAEILKEAAEYGRSKNWIARSPLLPGDTQ